MSFASHVDDGRCGTADCSRATQLPQQPPPPEIAEREARLTLHSIYFPTAPPTTAHPDGGLVLSQEQILAALATDFQSYLTFRPDGHLILSGHADERGSHEYDKTLTGLRVQRTKTYLVDHGVPPASVDTRSFGKEDELNAEQIKAQIAQNPESSPEDRKQMLANLPVMVLANSRRVDVSLNSTR